MKKILILGGCGLIGSTLAVHLSDMAGYEVFAADILVKKTSKNEKLTYLKVNVLYGHKISSLIEEIRPNIIINCINVATIYSKNPQKGYTQLVNFYVDLYKGLKSVDQPFHYIQMGTTGSGGLGFNIPFTHGDKIENLPIINKAAFSGVTTSMLTLLSRSFDTRTKVSEIKPGLSIFADKITEDSFGKSSLVLLNGGESGDYTYNELALLTCYMGFTSVSRVIDKVLGVLSGEKTEKTLSSHDIIYNINQTIISPEKLDLSLKKMIEDTMKKVQSKTIIIVTGNLGPPSLTADLIMSHAILEGFEFSGKERDFLKEIKRNQSVADTVEYIKQKNGKLYGEVIRGVSAKNYQILKALSYGNKGYAWEVVREKLGGV